MVNALMVRGLTHRYPGRGTPALDDLGFDLPENRLAFVLGPNGSGKSTLFRILLRLLRADSGEVEIGGRRLESYGPAALAGVISYIPQSSEVPFNFSGRHTVVLGRVTRRGLRASPREADWKAATEALEAVGMAGFEERGIQELSGGERRKLYLCTILMRNPNFLVLDEPTNDLDIQTLQVLEEYLQDFPGCVIIVSHDRYFMNKVVDHLLVFKGQGEVQDFPGNYEQYHEWLALQSKTDAPAVEANKGAKPKNDYHNDTRKRLSFNEKREFEQLEKEIEALETEQKQLEEALCSGQLSVDELTEKSKRLPVIKELLDEKGMRWLELAERA